VEQARLPDFSSVSIIARYDGVPQTKYVLDQTKRGCETEAAFRSDRQVYRSAGQSEIEGGFASTIITPIGLGLGIDKRSL
jgi:hypothetical protein